MQKRASIIFLISGLVITVVLAVLAYKTVIDPAQSQGLVTPTVLPTTPPTPTVKATLVPMSQQYVLGIDTGSQLDTTYSGISWIRLGYPSCGWGDLKGDVLKNTI